MSYAVGDHVVVRHDLKYHREINGVYITQAMGLLSGQVVTISEAWIASGDRKKFQRYRVEEDEYGWVWIDDFFEVVNEDIDDVNIDEMLFGVMRYET